MGANIVRSTTSTIHLVRDGKILDGLHFLATPPGECSTPLHSFYLSSTLCQKGSHILTSTIRVQVPSFPVEVPLRLVTKGSSSTPRMFMDSTLSRFCFL